MTGAVTFPTGHYGDCVWPTTGRAARRGRWSSQQAVATLRQHLRSPESPSSEELAVIDWVRRDLPDLTGERDRTTPEDLYRRIADSALGESMFASGAEGARQLGYGDLVGLGDEWAVSRFVGLGCPWTIGLPQEATRVLDLGCGSGLDLMIARFHVGERGLVIGVDRLPFLAERIRGAANVAIAIADARKTPLHDAAADLVTANGLPPLLGIRSAADVLREVHRLLRPGGELRFVTLCVGSDADLDDLPADQVIAAVRCSKPVPDQYRRAMRRIGFERISIHRRPSPFVTGYRGGPVNAVLVSAFREGDR